MEHNFKKVKYVMIGKSLSFEGSTSLCSSDKRLVPQERRLYPVKYRNSYMLSSRQRKSAKHTVGEVISVMAEAPLKVSQV